MEEKNFELKKHVNAIHCSNNLMLVQRKLFNALLFQAYSELPYKCRFHIHVKELCKLIGYNSNDYGKLKKALLGLITTAIEWNVIDLNDGHEKQWKASAALASAEISKGICFYEYSQTMKELLYRPEIYGKINLILVSKFKSGYGLALYENCIRYQGLKKTPWFNLPAVKKLMGVFDGKYPAFKDFKKRVLNVAVNEVNSISPIFVSPEIERQNQKVIRIRFKLNKNVLYENNVQEKFSFNKEYDEELKNILSKTFKLSDRMIIDVLLKYNHTYIFEKIKLIIKSENFLSGKIRNLAGYLIETIKNDYKEERVWKRNNKTPLVKKIKTKKIKSSNKVLYETNKNEEKISLYLSSLSKSNQEKLIEEFELYMKTQNFIFQKWYSTYNLNHPGMKAFFYNFIQDTKNIN